MEGISIVSSSTTTSRIRETVAGLLSEARSESPDNQHKALQTLAVITKVSPQNRNLLAQSDGAIPELLAIVKPSSSSSSSSSSSIVLQTLSLSILFNLSLNPDLKLALADTATIRLLNSIILSGSHEPGRLAASLICSLAMLDKNKARFGAAGTVQALVRAVSDPRGSASHHLLSSLAELVQFHGNCTLAVRSGAVPVLLSIVESTDGEDLAGTSLGILGLLARFDEGLRAVLGTEHVVRSMVEVLKGRCMLSKEGAAEMLLRLFDESEACVRDALGMPEFDTVLADLSVRGSARARERAAKLMRKLMEVDAYSHGNNFLLLNHW